MRRNTANDKEEVVIQAQRRAILKWQADGHGCFCPNALRI